MAIDTAAERRAIAHIARAYSGSGVTPNVAKDQAWRQQAGHGYHGILATIVSLSVNYVLRTIDITSVLAQAFDLTTVKSMAFDIESVVDATIAMD